MRVSRAQGGFTLIELIVAAAILAILSAALTPLVIQYIQQARVTRTESDMQTVGLAFLQYFEDTGMWPCNWTGASTVSGNFSGYPCFYTNTASLPGWDGPYLNRGTQVGSAMNVAASGTGGNTGLLDGWDRILQVHFQAPSTSIVGAAGGVIMLLSPGADGSLGTSMANAIAENVSGDDIVHIVTRRIR